MGKFVKRDIKDDYAIKLKEDDFGSGSLHVESNVRPNHLFTADQNLILYKVGHLKKEKMHEVVEKIVHIIRQS